MNELPVKEFAYVMRSLHENNESACIEAKRNFWDFTKIWETISALSNAASYHDISYAYMIWGIENNTWKITWTTFDARKENRWSQDFWLWLQSKLSYRDVLEDFTYEYEWERLYIMRIKQCWSIPLNFENVPYIKINSHNQLLNRYPDHLRKILTKQQDRTVDICEWARLDNLDPAAILFARQKYAKVKPGLIAEINQRDDATFLNKTKAMIWEKVTNAWMILLWKTEATHLLSPHVAQISRILKNRDGDKIDYEHFDWPLLLAVDKVFAKIRNLKYRYMTWQTIFPEEVNKYDDFVVREALHNCIAHQDYNLRWRINVIEEEDTLTFVNVWSFGPWSIENLLVAKSTQEVYRNDHLTKVMINYQMIDTIGSGIERMFKIQWKRFFPMPDYDISNDKVAVTIMGKVLDMNYAKKLLQVPNLSLRDMILLDRVQKKKTLKSEQIKYLRSKKYVEGNKNNLYVSLGVAQKTSKVVEYAMSQKNINEQRKKVLEFITLSGEIGVQKSEIAEYIEKKKLLEDGLTDQKKKSRIQNILWYLQKEWKVHTQWSWPMRYRFVSEIEGK